MGPRLRGDDDYYIEKQRTLFGQTLPTFVRRSTNTAGQTLRDRAGIDRASLAP